MDDPWHRQPDIALARDTLGWSPTTPLDEGLQRTAKYFRAVIAAMPVRDGRPTQIEAEGRVHEMRA